MTNWQEVVKCALVGTERQSPAFDATGEPVGALLSQLDNQDREGTLLRAAAILTPYRRAGMTASASAAPLPSPAPDDSRPTAPPALIQDILVMLSGSHREALTEWLASSEQSGWRVPDEHLAALIDFGARHLEFRSRLLALLGVRGRWLAAQNPDWKYAREFGANEDGAILPPEADDARLIEAWELGTKEQRTEIVRRLRRDDPGRARALVESVWPQEPPDVKASLLSSLEIGLTMDDEPFLESALDDRRKEVRTTAQGLLLRLIESRYAQRMWERSRSCVRLEMQYGAQVVVVYLPEACDKAMVRDGIDPKPSGNVGPRAWRLTQILHRTPLSLWTGAWNLKPDRIVAAASAKGASPEWKRTLVDAWSAALKVSPDRDWAVALFQYYTTESRDDPPTDVAWSELIPPSLYEAGLLRLFERGGKIHEWGGPVHSLLTQHNSLWSADFARTALKRLQHGAAEYHIIAVLAEFAEHVPEEVQGELIAIWEKLADTNSYATGQLNRYLELRAFRAEMRRKFAAAREN